MRAELVIGTTNRGKFEQIASSLADAGLHLTSLGEFGVDLPAIAEVGDSAATVAEHKAIAYSAALDATVLSMDYWLHFEGVSDMEQPGATVRRIPGHPDGADDGTLLEHYRSLIRRHGGEISGRWTLGVAVAGSRGVRSTTRVGRRRLFVDQPSTTRLPGFPLSSLQIDPETGRRIC